MSEHSWLPFYNRKSYQPEERQPHSWTPKPGRLPSCGKCITYHGHLICEDVITCPYKKELKEMQTNEHKENAD
uniref:Uncharacterized protein n=1 Tax=viral metagenome TaxID=1070528 RepID=A0A6M3X6C2_9ZZZZ